MPETFVGDFSKVKDRNFNIKRLPEGDYKAKITKVEDHESKQGNDNWLYTIVVTDGKGRGASYPYYCGLDKDSLWKIRNLYAACGVVIPKKKMKLRRDQLLNKTLGITLEDDEYEGKMKSVITNVMPVDEIDTGDDAEEDDEEVEEDEVEETEEDEEEEEEPPRKAKKKAAETKTKATKKKAKPAVDDDDDELEEIEIEEL